MTKVSKNFVIQILFRDNSTFFFRTYILQKKFLNFTTPTFEFLVEFVKRKVDVLMISEIKIEESFLLGQFGINGFNKPTISS